MRILLTLLTVIGLSLGHLANAQYPSFSKPYWQPVNSSAKGRAFVLKSANSLFPDTARMNGYVYQGNSFSFAQHYNDSSIFVFVPDHFTIHRPYEFVIWFHGWNNSIDSSLSTFQLAQQFYDARRNAIFIFPEGPKNAPDSYGGKWEDPSNTLLGIGDVIFMLEEERVIPPTDGKKSSMFNGLIMAGHSGAYKVMAKNQQFVKGMYLFDGLYGQMDQYQSFCTDTLNHKRFVHIYTDNGGTKENSLALMHYLDSMHVAYLHTEEEDVTMRELMNNRIIFLHSKKQHNEIITNRRNLERLLAPVE